MFELSSSSLSPQFQIQVPNLKSKVKRKGTGTGADTIILQATTTTTHPPHITFLTWNVNLVMGKDHPWPSLTNTEPLQFLHWGVLGDWGLANAHWKRRSEIYRAVWAICRQLGQISRQTAVSHLWFKSSQHRSANSIFWYLLTWLSFNR